MTAKELATMLNGREMGNEITPKEVEAAREAGLVVVFGSSNDCAEFRGAIDSEESCYDGGDIGIAAWGISLVAKIEAVWNDRGNPCWTYETDIPHETFEIYEDGELFCIGIVFSTKDLT